MQIQINKPVEYNKPYLTVEAQIELLRSRGMTVSDDDQARVWLRRVGYYRLSGYWYPFRERIVAESTSGPSNLPKLLDTFRPGTELSHAFNLYVFDKRLRLLFLDAIERLEVGLRVDIALMLGATGPWAHRTPDSFNRYFRSVEPSDLAVRHSRWLQYLDNAAARSRDEFVRHFFETYKDPLPIWIAIELWDFGTLSALVNGMKDKDLQLLADKYQIPKRTTLISWIQCLNFVRNICAHHGRLWNRPLIVQPSFSSNNIASFKHLEKDTYAKTRLYAAAVIVQYMLATMSPKSSWAERLKSQMGQFPGGPGIDIGSSGFPNNWENQGLWNR